MRKPVSENTEKTTLLQGLINSLENLDVTSGSIDSLEIDVRLKQFCF